VAKRHSFGRRVYALIGGNIEALECSGVMFERYAKIWCLRFQCMMARCRGAEYLLSRLGAGSPAAVIGAFGMLLRLCYWPSQLSGRCGVVFGAIMGALNQCSSCDNGNEHVRLCRLFCN